MKAAVAIGGTSALSACLSRVSGGLPSGTTVRSNLPDRQFAWMDHSAVSDATGEAKTPAHHVQLLLEYSAEGAPDPEDRETVEAALRTLEEGLAWSDEGLLFTIGYSPSYFDRFEESLPPDTGLAPPEEIIENADLDGGRGIEADHADAHLHLASNRAPAVLQAEEALKGNREAVNGVPVDATFEGVFSVVDRRTGFAGDPHDRWAEDIDEPNPVGEDAPVFFGFKSLFRDSQPTEDHVAIQDEDHPFQGGTTEQVSVLRDTEIQRWYDRNDHEQRAERMYSPEHSSLDTGRHGRKLSPDSGTKNRPGDDGAAMAEIAERTAEHAAKRNVVGHAQKIARARDPAPPILRRDFPSTDGGEPGLQFVSHQRTIDDFVRVRKLMSFVDPDDDVPAEEEVPIEDHGIQGYLEVERRGTFLVPPRELRALPPARP